MARYMKQADVIEMVVTYFPSFLRSRRQAIRLDQWMTGRQRNLSENAPEGIGEVDPDDPEYGLPYAPRTEDTNQEYDNLRSLSPNNFAGLVVRSVQQTAYVEGITRPGVKKLEGWDSFRRNRWLSRQSSLHACAIGMGQAYGIVLPGNDQLTGEPMSKMLTKSPKAMAAFYDQEDDEWPTIAIEAHPRFEQLQGSRAVVQTGWTVTVYDAYVFHMLSCKGNGSFPDDWEYIEHREHGLPVPPVARLANRIDLDGRTTGEIEPVLPLLRRIDQDVFDRLIVQRFGAWQVRYISGMAKPSNEAEQKAQALRLRVQDILISTNDKTKFGTLPAGPLEPMIGATDADLRLLAAISQTPPHHLLGLSSNLQAEALAAAESGLQRKGFDFRTNGTDFYEQMIRLDAMVREDWTTANAYDFNVRWRDTESRSMTQAADALGKLAVQLKVPIEMLWERIPGWTDDDVQRAKEMVEDGTFETLIQELMAGAEGGDDQQQTDGGE